MLKAIKLFNSADGFRLFIAKYERELTYLCRNIHTKRNQLTIIITDNKTMVEFCILSNEYTSNRIVSYDSTRSDICRVIIDDWIQWRFSNISRLQRLIENYVRKIIAGNDDMKYMQELYHKLNKIVKDKSVGFGLFCC